MEVPISLLAAISYIEGKEQTREFAKSLPRPQEVNPTWDDFDFLKKQLEKAIAEIEGK